MVLKVLEKEKSSSGVQEEVHLSKVSDEDLDKLLGEKEVVETGESTPEKEGSEPQEDKKEEEKKEEETTEEETQEESTETSEEEGGETEAETESESEGTSEESEDDATKEQDKQALQERLKQSREYAKKRDEEISTLTSELEESETAIDLKGTEVGTLRKLKQLKKESTMSPEEKEEFRQLNQDDPEAAHELFAIKREARKEFETKKAELENGKIVREYSEKVEKYIKSVEPDFDKRIDGITKIAKERFGVTDDSIRNFKRNPYANPPQLLRSFSFSARLLEENKSLKAENDKLKGKSGKIVEGIRKGGAKKKSISLMTGKTSRGSSSNGRPMTMEEFRNLSEAQLAKLPPKVFDRMMDDMGR